MRVGRLILWFAFLKLITRKLEFEKWQRLVTRSFVLIILATWTRNLLLFLNLNAIMMLQIHGEAISYLIFSSISIFQQKIWKVDETWVAGFRYLWFIWFIAFVLSRENSQRFKADGCFRGNLCLRYLVGFWMRLRHLWRSSLNDFVSISLRQLQFKVNDGTINLTNKMSY